MNKNSLFLRIYYFLSMKRCQNSIICIFFVVIRRKNGSFFLRMTTLKIQILNFRLSRRRSKKGAQNSLFYLFIDARRKNKSGSKRALVDDDGMDEKRHDGCDGRDHDAPFTNKTHACFVSTCYITRIAGDPRMNVNVRVHDSYKMATVTACARGALEYFVQIISSSLDSI